VNSIEAGSIRNCPVSVGEYGKDGVMKKVFYIAPAEDEVPALMQEFVEGMESLACNWANHPVIHAAIAHFVLVFVFIFRQFQFKSIIP
jgi:Fic family protein